MTDTVTGGTRLDLREQLMRSLVAEPGGQFAPDAAARISDDGLRSIAGLMSAVPENLGSLAGWEIADVDIVPATSAAGFSWIGLKLRSTIDAARPAEWAIVADAVALADPSLSLAITPTSGRLDHLQVQAEFSATLRVGDRFAWPATVRLPGVNGGARFESYPGLELSSLADLAAFVGGKDLQAILPGDVGSIGGIVLSYIRLDAAPNFAGLQDFAFALSCSQDWPIIADRLVIRDVRININIEKPATAARVTGYILGTLAIGDTDIEVAIQRYDAAGDWFLAVQTSAIPLPSLGDLTSLAQFDISGLLPSAFATASFTLYDLDIDLNLSTRQLEQVGFVLESDESWDFGAGLPSLENLRAELLLDWRSKAMTYGGRISGTLPMGDVRFSLWGDIADDFTLSGQLPAIDLSALLEQLLQSVAGPTELPEIRLDGAAMSVTPATGAFSLSGSSSGRWDFPPGGRGLTVNAVDVAISRTGDGTGAATTCAITVGGNEPAELAERVAIKAFELEFGLGAGNQWSVSGEVEAEIFGQAIALTARYGESNGIRTLRLDMTAEAPIEFAIGDGIGSMGISGVAIEFGQPDGGFEITGDVAISVDGLFETVGRLEIEKSGKATRLIVSTEAPKISPIALPLDVPEPPEIDLDIGPLRLAMGGASGFEITGDAALRIRHTPEILRSLFSKEAMRGSIIIDGTQTKVRVSPPVEFGIDFPELALTFGDGARLSLGQPGLAIETYTLDLKGKPKFGADIEVTLPRALNYLFGVDAAGQPSMILFKERLDLGLEIGKGLRLKARTSPLELLEFYEKYGNRWTDWDFGVFGRMSFQVPEFSFEKGKWVASVGVERLGELQLPLWLLKSAMAKVGFPEPLVAPIPDSVPLVELDLRSDNFHESLMALLGPDAAGRLSPEAAAILTELAKALREGIDRLPDRMAEYLTLRVPESLTLDMAAAPNGGFHFDLRTHADEDLKILMPILLGPLPELAGLSFRQIGFGLAAGGSVATIRLDGHLDRIDPISLTFSLVTGLGDQISNRFVFRDTFMLAATAAPVAVPIFYSDLGWEYRDLLGLELQTHWRFPEPDVSIGDFATLIGGMVQFLNDEDFLLHRSGAPEALPLSLTVGPNFVTLPDYLGGASLGPKENLPSFDVTDSVMRLLDGLKTLNAGYLITAIPLKIEKPGDDIWIRVGHRSVSFGPLAFEAAWCVTTEKEFVEEVLADPAAVAMIGDANGANVLKSLPTERGAATIDRGFIVLLMGRAGLSGLIEFESHFGLALTATGGFETGFLLAGELASALRLELSGRIAVAPPQQSGATECEGRIRLTLLDINLIDAYGAIRSVPGESFEMEVILRIGPVFQVAGLFRIANDGLTIRGTVTWGYTDGANLTIGTLATVSKTGVALGFDAKLFDFDANIGVRQPLRGPAEFTAGLTLPSGFHDMMQGEVVAIADTAASETERALKDIESLASQIGDLELSIAGVKSWLPRLCDSIISTITTSVNRGVDRRWPSKKVWGVRISAPGRGNVKAAAQRSAKPTKDRLARLKSAALRADRPDGRPALKAAIDDLIRNNSLSVRVSFPWIGRKTLYTRSPVIPTAQINLMKTARNAIDKLPRMNGPKVDADAVYKRAVDKEVILNQVKSSVEEGLTEGIPIVKRIEFSRELGRVSRLLTLDVVIGYRGSDRIVSADVDLGDVALTARNVSKAFADTLA